MVRNSRKKGVGLRALHGRGAFRYFKDCLHRHGITDAWYLFREQALKQIAIQWLEEEEIPYRDDIT